MREIDVISCTYKIYLKKKCDYEELHVLFLNVLLQSLMKVLRMFLI